MRKQHRHIQCRKQHEHNREQCRRSRYRKGHCTEYCRQNRVQVGIVQYVDDASLNQIEKAIEAELDAKGAELGVTFDYADYTYNGQADSSTLNQIAADLVAEGVDVIIPIATPAAMIMQNATEDNQIPIVFSAVSDPVEQDL